jgi:hypothetical protein
MSFDVFNVMWWKEREENVRNFSKLNKTEVKAQSLKTAEYNKLAQR